MEDFLKGVKSDPPADTGDLELSPEELKGEAAETGHGEGAEGDEGKGRTIENVHRELSRKMEEFQNKVMQQVVEGQERIAEALKVRNAPEKKTGGTLDDMSITELETLRAQVESANPDKLGEFDAYLNQRRVTETVESRMADWESRQAAEQMRSKAQQDALRRYPELADRSSEMYRTVNARLNELGPAYVGNNPRAVLDAANDVAAELGVAPRSATRQQAIRGRVANKSNSKPNAGGDTDDKPAMDQSEYEAISKRLKSALPPGKDFDPKAVQERAGFYKKNSQYYLGG